MHNMAHAFSASTNGLFRRVSGLAAECPIVTIFCLAVLIRILFFIGLTGMDDSIYGSYVHDLLTKGFILPDTHWKTRAGMIIPLYLFTKLLSFNEYTLAIFPLLCSLTNVLLIYKIGSLLFSRRHGLLAALLYAFFPLDIYYATSAFPTVPLVTCTGLSAFFLLRNRKHHSWMNYLFSGLAIGGAYLVHMTAVFMFLFIGLYLLIFDRRHLIKKSVFLFLTFLTVLAIESSLYGSITGDPFYRFHVIKKTHFQQAPEQRPPDVNPKALIKRSDQGEQVLRGDNFWIEPAWTLLTQQEFGLYFYFIIPATIFLLFRRRKDPAVLILAIWFLPILFYIFYGTTSLTHYATLRRWPRYFSMTILPAILLLSVWIQDYCLQRKTCYFTVIIILTTSSLGIISFDNWRRYAATYRDTARYISSHPGTYYAHVWSSYLYLFPYVPASNNVKLIAIKNNSVIPSDTGDFLVNCQPGDTAPPAYPLVATISAPETASVKLAKQLHFPQSLLWKLEQQKTCFILQLP